jgi:hypothetical protein
MSDPKEQIKIRNIQLDNIFDEVNELKGIFKDAWEDICNVMISHNADKNLHQSLSNILLFLFSTFNSIKE